MYLENTPYDIRVLDADEEDALLDQLRDSNAPSKFRNYLIIKLILETGITNGEVIELTWDQIDFEEGSIFLDHDKDYKRRVLLMGWGLVDELYKWNLEQKRCIGNSEWVFSKLDGDPISARYLRNMIYTYAENAHLNYDGRINPSVLRHTFAVKLLSEENVSYQDVIKALGLSGRNLSTAQYRKVVKHREALRMYEEGEIDEFELDEMFY